jgi:transposase
MPIKRPFSDLDWLATPKPVRAYIEQLENIIIQHSALISNLEKRIDELESKLNRNSKNSNQPPSKDSPFDKPKKEASTKKKDKKRKKGGQKGHKGHKRELLAPTKTVDLLPECCSCGNHDLSVGAIKPFYTHQVLELPEIQLDVTHFILHSAECKSCGRRVKATLPKHVRPGYGPRLTALIAEMSGVMGSSRETVQRFCSSALGFYISIGAIQNVIDRASLAIEPIYDEIGRQVRRAEVNHVDETSFFQKGNQLQWLWVLVNTTSAFFMIHKNRSKAAFEELIQNWKGILISDDYGVYRKWFKKQSCLAHLIRQAKALLLKKDEQIKTFGQKTLKELQLLCHWSKEPPSLDEELEWIYRFTILLSDHAERKDDAGKFARTLARQLESLWLFLDENGVEPTNNRAERALRFAVIWRKRSYGTQSEKGDRWVERILTLKETCRLRSISTFEIITHALESFFKDQSPDLDYLTEI